jgi:NADH-quinone oxidoreductase subunit J
MVIALGCILLALGIWLLLPGGSTRRSLGGLLAAIGFGLIGAQLPWVGHSLAEGLQLAMSIATVVAALATISCRSPVYSAIWFGMTLAGTAGLFLLAGAEFLAVATIVVYAGAILVTFLFVLMLSQPEGYTTYDRRSWEALISACTGAVLVGILTATIGASLSKVGSSTSDTQFSASAAAASSSKKSDEPITISRLGAELFTQYLLAVEAAGALLFAALVGAAVIVAQGRAAMKGRNPLARQGGTVHAS